MLSAAFALALAIVPGILGDVLPAPGTMLVADRRIDIPNLPAGSVAYNPSMVRLEDGRIIMVFRLDRADLGWAVQMQLGFVELDEQFQVMRGPALVDTRDVPWANHTSEDPRLVQHLGELYVVFNATHDGSMNSRRAMRIGHIRVPDELDPDDDFEVLGVSELIPDVPGFRPWQEKNWTPFSCGDEVHLVYRTSPPQVFRIPQHLLDVMPKEIRVPEVSRLATGASFGYGEMRGGSGAMLDANSNQYISFFHARDANNYGGGRKLHYFIGFYAFDPAPPFAISHLLPVPIVVPTMSNPGKLYLEVAYPGGFIVDDELIYVCYGKNDRSIRLLTLDRAKLYALARPQPGREKMRYDSH